MGSRDVAMTYDPAFIAALNHNERIRQDVDMVTARINCRFSTPVTAKYRPWLSPSFRKAPASPGLFIGALPMGLHLSVPRAVYPEQSLSVRSRGNHRSSSVFLLFPLAFVFLCD